MDDRYIGKGILKEKRIAVYAGSFDPVTLGHMWVIHQAAHLFDELIVGIGDNPDKSYTFTPDERSWMLEQSIESPIGGGAVRLRDDTEMTPIHGCDIKVMHFENKFLIDFAVQQNARVIVRGVRNSTDFEFEKKMAHFNGNMKTGHPIITTVVLIPPPDIEGLSSSFVKGLCGPEYWQQRVEQMVPEAAFGKLLEWKGCPDWSHKDDE